MFILFVCVQITDSWVVHSEIVEDEDTDEEADEEKEDVTRSPPSQRRDPEPMVSLLFSFLSFLFSFLLGALSPFCSIPTAQLCVEKEGASRPRYYLGCEPLQSAEEERRQGPLENLDACLAQRAPEHPPTPLRGARVLRSPGNSLL